MKYMIYLATLTSEQIVTRLISEEALVDCPPVDFFENTSQIRALEKKGEIEVAGDIEWMGTCYLEE